MSTESEAQRSTELSFEIAAPVEAVWKALTDAEELTRWFPLKAEVKPGVGGYVRSIWTEEEDHKCGIAVWEPNSHLREVWGEPGEPDMMGGTQGPEPLAVDFFLEGRGGETVLRMVHSGFSADSKWDEFFDAVRRGWEFELRGLRHYLEHHPGKPRRVAWSKRKCAVAVAEAWDRLMSEDGLLRGGKIEGLREGDTYAIEATTGESFSGIVHINEPPKDFCATIENLNNAFLRIRIDAGCNPAAPGTEVNYFVSTFDIPQSQVEEFESRWNDVLAKLYE